MMRVSAGVIRRQDGRILICKRGEGRKNAHLWEFPGGKQEAGETAADCLQREIREELLMQVCPGEMLFTEEKEGILFDFVAAVTDETPTLTEHEAMAWVTPREMLHYSFCPADTDVALRMALQDPPLTNFLWDFDGTLMDTYPAMVQAVIRAAAKQGMHPCTEQVTTWMMHDLRYCLHQIATAGHADEEQLYRDYRQEEALIPPDQVSMMPGMEALLEALHQRGGRHFLVTHRGKDAWSYLTHAGVSQLFAGGITREAGLPRKPAPDMLLRVMEDFHLAPEQTIMIGDRPLDTEAGQRAGILSCMLDTSGRFREGHADLYAGNAAELMAILCPKDLHL